MYKDYYRMKLEAFGNLPLLKIFFKSRTHTNAWHYLLYGLDSQEPFLIITGDYGMGKTTLCLGLVRMLKKKAELPFAYISSPGYGFGSILSEIVESLKIDVPAGDEAAAQAAVYRYFRDNPRRKSFHVIIDDAHDLDVTTLEKIRSLANFNINGNFPFRMIFFAHSSFLERLNTPRLIPLDQRFKRRTHLDHFGFNEVKEYIFSRLYKAGAPGVPTFTDNALQHILAASNGVPRLINNICDTCLLIGATGELTEINAAVVAEAVRSAPGRVAAKDTERFIVSEPAGDSTAAAPAEPERKESRNRLELNLTAPKEEQPKKKPPKKSKKLFIRILLIIVVVAFCIWALRTAANFLWQTEPFFSPGEKQEETYQSSAPEQAPASATAWNTNTYQANTDSPPASDYSTQAQPYSATDGSGTVYVNDGSDYQSERASGLLSMPQKSDLDTTADMNTATAAWPYSLHLESYRSMVNALEAMPRYRRSGLSPYLVKVNLGSNKGIWWRMYVGLFTDPSAAQRVKDQYHLMEASVQNTAWANFMGAFDSQTQMASTAKQLEQLGYFPYAVSGPGGRLLLYVGAFLSRSEAEDHNSLLIADGLKSRVKRR